MSGPDRREVTVALRLGDDDLTADGYTMVPAAADDARPAAAGLLEPRAAYLRPRAA
jgi:hypothetical protein